MKSPHDTLSKEVIKALAGSTIPPALQSGVPYILPVNFNLIFYSGKVLGSQIRLPDSLHAKLYKPRSYASTVTYNPDNVTLPPKPKPIILNEVTKIGYLTFNSSPGIVDSYTIKN